MPKAATDWDVCLHCSHTSNIHDKDGVCGAYLCTCETYELKRGK